ncbi:SH3 domain-containing protein [Ruegeria arenilitoris]|uniref:SH3 domain-containing protein n=1 Tax=Ruegeria arenilitoris TaxID=1173585 RepID=UPI0020C489D8|nr:SH3 domain-containing protein [Ruegeria arenilitoris]
MTRLMLVTFAMLGWFFYVMSGGSEFEPRGTRAEAPPVVAAAEKPEPRPLVPSPATELVTKVALRPAKPSEPKPEPIPAADAVDTEALLAQIAAGLNSDLSSFDNTGGTFSLASLDENAAVQVLDTDAEPETAAAPAPAEPPKDIRIVSGTRVNMRDGPGTIYPIIGKARMGQQVEVLSESGTGWLRLRVLPEQQVGWISSSLIRKSTN